MTFLCLSIKVRCDLVCVDASIWVKINAFLKDLLVVLMLELAYYFGSCKFKTCDIKYISSAEETDSIDAIRGLRFCV